MRSRKPRETFDWCSPFYGGDDLRPVASCEDFHPLQTQGQRDARTQHLLPSTRKHCLVLRLASAKSRSLSLLFFFDDTLSKNYEHGVHYQLWWNPSVGLYVSARARQWWLLYVSEHSSLVDYLCSEWLDVIWTCAGGFNVIIVPMAQYKIDGFSSVVDFRTITLDLLFSN